MPEPPSHVLPSQQLTARWPMQTAWIIRFGSSHNWARSLLKHTKACFKSFVRVLDPYRQDTVQISKESWEVRRRGARTIGQGCPIRQRNVREGNELLTYQKSSLDDSREVSCQLFVSSYLNRWQNTIAPEISRVYRHKVLVVTCLFWKHSPLCFFVSPGSAPDYPRGSLER